MKFSLLASGSSGNCGFVSTGETEILVDAGISVSRIKRELESFDVNPQNISAIFITHEHGDHTSQLARIAVHLDCPVYITERTMARVPQILRKQLEIINFEPNETINIGNIRVDSFPVFHDAVEPCGFVFRGPSSKSNREASLGYATDVGRSTPPLMEAFSQCNGIVIEANHDLEMLIQGKYPFDLKQRIRSPIGHLSNHDAAQLIKQLVEGGNLEIAMLAHLSKENNNPQTAVETIQSELQGLFQCEIIPSFQTQNCGLAEI